MTIKETAHQLIDRLDDEQIARLLSLAGSFLAEQSSGRDATTQGSEAFGEDPVLALIGAGRTAEPTDVARFKDEYLAAAFGIDRE
jgi:hypothetical protein